VKNDELTKKLTISKMDAAKRQLDAAIALWFSDGDPVAIHTLVGASYQILHDLNEKKGNKDLLFDADFIVEEHREEVKRMLRKDFNFFKHADLDPDGITEFVPLASWLFMLMGIQTLRALGERNSDTQSAFTLYTAIHKPEWVSAEYVAALKAHTPADYLPFIASVRKDEFFKAHMQNAGILRAQGKIA
jgi:hypothetical protein